MPIWLQIILGALGALTAVFLFILGLWLKRAEKRDATREEAQALILTGLLVGGELGVETATAVRDKKCNGTMERALSRQQAYNGKLSEFLAKSTAKAL